jgi:hypothetical protein
VRWASFLPVSDGMVYLVSTSTGVFATDTLMSTSTVWVNQGAATIGSQVCDMTDVRVSDGLVVVATHAHGMFSTHITSVNDIVTVHEQTPHLALQTNIYPNPATEEVNVKFELPSNADVEILLLDELGQTVKNIRKGKEMKGEYTEKIPVNDLAPGLYYVSIVAGEMRETKQLVIAK